MKLLVLARFSFILLMSATLANNAIAVQFYLPYDASLAKQLTERANQGDAEAQNRLGAMYANGQNVARDSSKAVALFRKSAEQGNANAQYNLGVMYQTGQGVSKDDAQAILWIRKAAAQFNALALNNLGWLYAHGQSLPYQPVVAYVLYSLSAEADVKVGVYAIGNRTALARAMSNGEVDAAQHLTQEMQVPGYLLEAMDSYIAHHVPALQ